ncbi:MAG: hypothetical protein ACRCST_00345 [Turicibacter sp.]
MSDYYDSENRCEKCGNLADIGNLLCEDCEINELILNYLDQPKRGTQN